jgi:hypothetical protein
LEDSAVTSLKLLRRSKVKQSILILIVLCGLLLGGCAKSSNQPAFYTGPPLNDTEFAKEVFRLLAEGDEGVTPMLDWEHLNLLGNDIGTVYKGNNNQPKFINDFISSYSRSFKARGGKAENASNWREHSRDANNTVVAADNQAGQSMLITVTHVDGHQKVTKMELQ